MIEAYTIGNRDFYIQKDKDGNGMRFENASTVIPQDDCYQVDEQTCTLHTSF